MFKSSTGPMWWGICVVLAFTAAVSLRFNLDGGAHTAKADPPSHIATR